MQKMKITALKSNVIFLRIYDGTQPGLIVGRPDLVRQIMVGQLALDVFRNRRAVKTTHPVMAKFLSSLEDDTWKRVRSITAPTFTSGKLKRIIPCMTAASGPLLANLAAAAANASDLDLKALFGAYTMDVIAHSAFATTPDDVFVQQASLLFTFPFWRKFLDYIVPMAVLEKFSFTVLPKDPMTFFREVTIRIIRHRRATGEMHHQDFLQLLMDAEETEETGSDVKKKLTEEEILAQSVLFFSVGFETSSQLLAYAGYCLALNPDVQDTAYEKIIEALQKKYGTEIPEEIDPEELTKIKYLNAVLDETLRLYNPVLRMERRASSDFQLGDTNIIIPKGMIVGIPVWAMHHSEEFYPDPWAFDPERFLTGNIVPGTYLPFGDGPRNCIGSRFALLESRIALAKILLKFKFVRSPTTKVPLEFFPTGRPLLGPKAIVVRVEERN